MNRRHFLRSTALAAAALPYLPDVAQAVAAAEGLETRVISREPQFYHGWPTVARRQKGDLVLVYSGGREQHICPFGRVELMVSHDHGETWCWPQVLLDSPIDDRDAGVLETAKGSLLVTSFTSLAYEPVLEKARHLKPGEPGAWPADRLGAWLAADNRLSAGQRRAELGEWMLRSTDGGVSWSARYPSLVNSPHGPIQLADGRLLYAGKELWTGQKRVGVCDSRDDGASWKWLAQIPARPGDDAANYHELHAVQTTKGLLLAHIRNHNRRNEGETLQVESEDGGRTWSLPHPIGVWGFPSFLLRLRSGQLLMTYGYRRAPFGIQARLSRDEGQAWSEPLFVSSDGTSGDLGYPSTVELQDNAFLSVWYEALKPGTPAVLRQARWKLRA